MTDFHEFEETILSSNLDQIACTKDGFHSIFSPLLSGVHEFCYKNLLAYMSVASSTVETIFMTFPYLVNFYLQIQAPINLISMPTTYLESFGVDSSENKLFQCVSILLTGTSTFTVPSHPTLRVMQGILAPFLWTFALVYINNILIFSKLFEHHFIYIESVLEAIKDAKIT